jgi:flagellar P-ring protein precursor FlgI
MARGRVHSAAEVVRRKIRRTIQCANVIVAALQATLMAAPACPAARVKDLVHVAQIGAHKVIGYGLVVGLEGTGDGRRVAFTGQAVANMLNEFGLTVRPEDLRLRNVAAVAVTADLPPFAGVGSTVDVLVSSMGDAESLQGGTLLMTPLRGLDDQVYVVAQGPISIGGFAAAGGGQRTQKNHVAVGRAIGAGSVVRPVAEDGAVLGAGLSLTLTDPDFTTATRVADAINAALGDDAASAADAASVIVRRRVGSAADLAALMAQIEATKVVVNERTGTVVMGAGVRLLPTAVSHGGLKVQVRTRPRVSQPAPLSNGTTTTVTEGSLRASEEPGALQAVQAAATVDQLVSALNALGASPRDLIAILQALRQAGALQARLEIM